MGESENTALHWIVERVRNEKEHTRTRRCSCCFGRAACCADCRADSCLNSQGSIVFLGAIIMDLAIKMESAEDLEQEKDDSSTTPTTPVPPSENSDEGVATGYQDQLNESDKSEGNGESVDEIDKDGDDQDPDQNEIDSDEFSYDDEELTDDDDDIDESEIDSLLEQGLPKSKRLERANTQAKPAQCPVGKSNKSEQNSELTIKKILVLDEKDENAFEVLPGGWIKLRHSSGMPLYLHRKTRVCTLSKPYYLGTGSARRHSIPLSGIPCLAYRRALEKEQKEKLLMEEQAKETEIAEQADEASKMQEDDANQPSNKLAEIQFSSPDDSIIAEKLNKLKRKLDLGKETVEITKREKLTESNDLAANSHQDSKATSEKEACTKKEGKSTENNSTDDSNITKSDEKGTEGGASTVVTEEKAGIPNKDQKKAENHFIHARRLNKRGGEGGPGIKNLIPLAKVETAKENASLYSVPALDLRSYCSSLFRFTEVECKRFKTWSARRRHTKEQKRRQLERPTLPDNAQVIKFFDLGAFKGGDELMVKKFNDYVFNPNGKSSVCILHEFVQHTLRKQPTYSFQELENAATPYAATVIINDTAYGRGFGSSKKTAKAEAAKATLEIMIPEMKTILNGNKADPNSDFDIAEYFQQVEMNDTRIPKLCTSVSEPSPYTLLLTCLQRNYGQSGSSNVKFEMMPADLSKGNPPNQFKMTAGNYSVVVTASNKKEGKQLASQLLLSQIHPHITNFGAFIKMYGNGSIKSVKEKKQEEQQITTLQSKASANSPNWAILNKLRQEMLKLVEQERKKKPECSPINDPPLPEAQPPPPPPVADTNGNEDVNTSENIITKSS